MEGEIMNYRSIKLLREFSKFLVFSENLKDEEARNKVFFELERGMERLNFVRDLTAPADSRKVN
jgi:hypothetical protein